MHVEEHKRRGRPARPAGEKRDDGRGTTGHYRGDRGSEVARLLLRLGWYGGASQLLMMAQLRQCSLPQQNNESPLIIRNRNLNMVSNHRKRAQYFIISCKDLTVSGHGIVVIDVYHTSL